MIYPTKNNRLLVTYLIQLFCIACILFLACVYYSFSGSLPPHLKTVNIPLFDDRTSEFGLREELTDEVINEFTKDNSLKLVDRNQADIYITGIILSVQDYTGAYNVNEQVQEIKVTLSVKIKCEDVKKRTVMWEETLRHYGNYDPNTGIEGRKEAISEAIQKIAGDVLNKTVSGW
ncbi:LptE family protein [candidate division KSB1 bacterium]|nr:LptE family protein [candidate division KSB1 bacterium]